MDCLQKTIGREIEFFGRGMFHGEEVKLVFKPAALDSGIRFVRVDLPNKPVVPAQAFVSFCDYKCTLLKINEVKIEGVEHLMAAFAGLGIDNIEIEIDGREVPAGDGSAKLFLETLKQAGVVLLGGKKKVFTVQAPIEVRKGNASVLAVPEEKGLFFSYSLDFNGSYIEPQTFDVEFSEEVFSREIAPARTFGLISYIEEFKKRGLGKGITDDNSVIVHEDGKPAKPISMKPAELRFPDEFVRHKMLDLIGDLYLANVVVQGRIIASRSGHSLNVQLAEKIARRAQS
ncbi:MAG: UDP-3-O-acyl-N-acetylglucosamine deacetylase [Candidatus Brocadiaceae bacterium]|nr:UDP-3-O-acyl-N-acetylglucosamine deacetylase [Candidatus Brocadiaceae bacterium]